MNGKDSAGSMQVSVVTPFFNMQAFLEESIESVRAQTFSRWELLLCDDGSTDRSTAIARSYAARDPERIRYLEHPGHVNRGASAARNLGLSAARGEFVALLDADDVWLPNHLEDQVSILRAHPEAAMMYGATELWFGWSGRPEDRARDCVPSPGLPPNHLYEPPTLIVPVFLHREALTPCTCSVLLRREAALRVGGFEESFRVIYTDQAFFVKVCLTGSVFLADGCWDRYRQYETSSYQTVKRSGHRDEARYVFLRWLERYLAEQRVENEEIWRELRKELHRYRFLRLLRLRRGAHATLRAILDRGQKLRNRVAPRRDLSP